MGLDRKAGEVIPLLWERVGSGPCGGAAEPCSVTLPSCAHGHSPACHTHHGHCHACQQENLLNSGNAGTATGFVLLAK